MKTIKFMSIGMFLLLLSTSSTISSTIFSNVGLETKYDENYCNANIVSWCNLDELDIPNLTIDGQDYVPVMIDGRPVSPGARTYTYDISGTCCQISSHSWTVDSYYGTILSSSQDHVTIQWNTKVGYTNIQYSASTSCGTENIFFPVTLYDAQP